jgi:hypothetical protein
MTDRITALKEKLCILPRALAKELADGGEIVCSVSGEEIVEDFKCSASQPAGSSGRISITSTQFFEISTRSAY